MRLASLVLVSLFTAAAAGQGAWESVGTGLAGINGIPLLSGSGPLVDDGAVTISLAGAKASSSGFLFVSLKSTPTPFKGGLLVTNPVALSLPETTDASGGLVIMAHWPAGLPAGFKVYLQVAIADPAAVRGVSLSNGLKAATPVAIRGAEAWWPGDPGIDFKDIAPHPNPADAHDATPIAHATVVPEGKVGGAFYFDGIMQGDGHTACLTISHIDGLNGANDNRTVEFWVIRQSGSGDPSMCFHMGPSGGSTSSAGTSFNIRFTAIPPLGQGTCVSVATGGGVGWDFFSGMDVGVDVWHHVAATYDGGTHTLGLYLDGTALGLIDQFGGGSLGLVGNGIQFMNTSGATASLAAGNSSSPASQNLKGYLDEVTFYNRVLSSDEIEEIYDAGSAGKVKPQPHGP